LHSNATNYSDTNINKTRNNNIKIKPSQKAELHFLIAGTCSFLKVITKKEKKKNENKNFLRLGIEPTPVPAVGSL